VGFQADDLERIVRPSGKAPADVSDRAFEQQLRSRLARAGRRPVVVYLSAVGVADEQGAFLLRSEPGSLQAFAATSARQTLVTPRRLVELFAEAPSTKKLLILDAAQVGSDRNLGVFANGFVARLKSYLETNPVPGLAVLSSCAPGQIGWVSETDTSSVFGYYVAQGLAGAASDWDPEARGLTVHGLARFVRQSVAHWVAANRQAEQTPMLFGDMAVNFLVPRATRSAASIAAHDTKETERLLARLDEAWTRRDALQARDPYRHAPLRWRRYFETLLAAEKRVRFGDHAEADELLGQLPALEKSIAEAAGGLPLANPWSLALLEREIAAHPSEPRRAEVRAVANQLNDALAELTQGDEDAQPIETEPTNEPGAGSTQPEAAAKPEAEAKAQPGKAVEPALTAKRQGAAPSGKPRKTVKSGGSALAGLTDRVDRNRPVYVEAQLLVWTDTFVKRSGASYGFNGLRAELLDEAVLVRKIAEQAAASDDRISHWITALVDAGDEPRRRAQDGLFVESVGAVESLRRQLDEARTRYRQSLETAGRCARALQLVEQIEAELPYYGEWKARQPGRRGDGLDADLLALLATTTTLARQLQSGSGPVQSGSRGSADEAEADIATPEAASARAKELEPVYRETKERWDRLVAEFQAEVSGLATAGGSGRWREIDRLLSVPLVPVEQRRALLRRIRSIGVAATLAAPDRPGGPGEGPGLTARADVRSTADPDFWNQALALARLEWGLLELGGAPQSELARVESAFDSARNAVAGDAAFDAFERLSLLLRSLRAERFQAIRRSVAPTEAMLVASDRTLRVIPLAEVQGAADTVTETLDRYRRQALLVWHGRRLLRDFAPEQAARLFEEARQVFDTEAARLAEEEAAAMRRAQVSVVARSSGGFAVGDWTEQPLVVDVATTGKLPPGEAVVLVAYDAARPLAVTATATRQAARAGVLVKVAPDRPAQPVEYLVQRTESTPETLKVPVRLGAFYRGHVFRVENEIDVTLETARDPVAVTIAQSYEGLAFKDFGDQFKEHPGQGFLHYGTNLKYKLILSSDRTMKVAVRYGLKEHPESFQTKTLEISPKRRGEVIDMIRGNDFPIVKTSELLDIAPLTLVVTVSKERDGGEVLGKAVYPIRMIAPPQYIAVSANFDFTARLLYLDVVHLANDPVTGPVKVYASIGGQEGWAWIRRSRFVTFAIPVPPNMKKVTWRVGVESMPGAFREEIETPTPQVEEPAKAPAL
jgi:hypothetical protein